ncbi:MAG: ABC transporter substrate-binding protein, partial [Bauldia sp.]
MDDISDWPDGDVAEAREGLERDRPNLHKISVRARHHPDVQGTEYQGAQLMRRRDLIKTVGIGAAVLTLPRIGLAQSNEVKFVASLIGANPPPNRFSVEWSAAVEEGLAGQGWIVGDNLRIEHRFSPGEVELSIQHAAELIAMGPDLLVCGSDHNAAVVQRLGLTIPWVFGFVPDPVALGLVTNIARPEGNVTGITHLDPSAGGFVVQLLLAVAPDTTRIFMLTNRSGSPINAMLPFVEAAAEAAGLPLEIANVEAEEEIEPTIARIATVAGAGIVLQANNWIHNRPEFFVDAINRYKIPAAYSSFILLEAGGLIGIGIDPIAGFSMVGDYAGRILNGTPPGNLPVQPMPYTVRVNVSTAASQGITI